jgi:hypothetical protein
MKEVIHSIEEFKAKIDPSKPIHHCATRKSIDQHGIFQRITFRIYGVDKTSGHILIFQTQKTTAITELDEQTAYLQKLVEKFAKPLGSTEGAWML